MFNPIRLGISGGIGFLIGLILVSWVGPTTDGGVVLLIVISVVFCTVLGGIALRSFRKRGKAASKD